MATEYDGYAAAAAAAAAAAFPQERREVAKTSGIFSADFRTVDFRTFFVRFRTFSSVLERFRAFSGCPGVVRT